ncbi:O-antigen ligase domain-containing protein [Arundinibacter roseus]|uniref:O-antigen ligase domain-containing protein n=1 Tax=Arundinibacter roseus TaxID=2070510 RepID=A0A4R4JYF0_9BACT|nr:O-antigen ligase domain-containing protein [Arundinibacter roseus]
MLTHDGKSKFRLWPEATRTYERTGILILIAASILIGISSAVWGIYPGVLVIGLWVIPGVYSIVAYPRFGITVLLLMAYMLFMIIRLGINFPWGTTLDGIQLLLILGFFAHQKTAPDWSVFRGPIATWVGIWVIYNLLQFGNPTAESRMSWLYTVRTTASVTLMYYIFMYHIRTVSFIRFLVKMWLVLAFIGAAYAFKQEYFGFSAAEQAWLNSDPLIADLLFINGHWRKYSIFSDPVSFSYNMVVSSLLCLGVLKAARQSWKKIVLLCLMGFYLFTMLFSGTRGAYVLIPAGFALFAILNLNRTILILSIIGAVFFIGLIFVPTSNTTLYRFQSAFKPSNDDSFNLRSYNQKRIQPFIQSHPFGGGLGATGVWGQRFAPHSFLANFPPDSGYVRVAVELGWVGLFIFCMLMYTILKTGINNYYNIKNPELKAYCLAMTLIVYALNVGNYPQEALVQFPTSIFFYVAVALINCTYLLDQKEQEAVGQGLSKTV